MDTVNFVLALLAMLTLSTIGACVWALRERYARQAAQQEITRLVAQSRPRSPHHAAGYDTGLADPSYLRPKRAAE